MLPSFFDILFPPRESEQLVRPLGDDGLTVFMDPQVRTLLDCDIVTLLPYQESVVRACVVEAKYHANEAAAKALGKVLAAYLHEELIEMNLYERRSCALVPVPLSHARLHERGYNQAEVIARHALDAFAELEIETGLIVRTRDTLPQTTLDGKARRENVRGAFGAAHPPDPNITYIVIDDVVTTGATMSEVMKVLQNAGAEHVMALALAH